MKFFSFILLVAALGATPTSSSVIVQPSNISFKQALAACPSGTLGAISFALSHLRVAEAPGVDTDIDSANPNAQTVMLTSGNRAASAFVNASKHIVAAKNVTLGSSKRVACVAPD
jgi:hypothetical protein